MKFFKIISKTSEIFAFISFFIAGLSVSGLLLSTDRTGKILWSFIWGLIGIGWLIGIIQERKAV